MKGKIKSVIKFCFGTENNISDKLSFSFFVIGTLLFIFTITFIDNQNAAALNVISYASGTSFALWIISAQSNNSFISFLAELFRISIFFLILVFSLYFFTHSIFTTHGISLIAKSILAYLGLFCCAFYLISKFADIFLFIKNLFKRIKNKLFNSMQNNNPDNKTTKFKSFIENCTAFLVSITGLGVAIKAIIEPLINLIKPWFSQL